MASRRLDDVSGPQVAGQFARLGGRLDNDKSPAAPVAAATAAAAVGASGAPSLRLSQLRLRSISDPGSPRNRPR
ncbi:hypothetical protein I546_5859 [Mycobacterium kansasii 732]|nr:hypothetical protein I546_5859 [Mycobacterium kansasii 732]